LSGPNEYYRILKNNYRPCSKKISTHKTGIVSPE